MSPGADARERPDADPRVRRAARPASAPARPELGGQAFAAAMDVGGPPRSLTTSVVLWLLAGTSALAAAALMWAGQDGIRARLAAMTTEQDPSAAADVVADTARYAFLACAGSVVLVAVLHVLLALALRTGREWARTALVIAGVLGVVVAVLVQDLIADPALGLRDDPARETLLGHVVLVLAATVTMLTPSARRWLRRARAVRR